MGFKFYNNKIIINNYGIPNIQYLMIHFEKK